MSSQVDAAKAAEELARILLDVDVLVDDVEDAVQSDEEFLEIAVAREAIGNAEVADSPWGDRCGRLQGVQYDLDKLAAESLAELLETEEIDVDDVAGPCPVVGRSA